MKIISLGLFFFVRRLAHIVSFSYRFKTLKLKINQVVSFELHIAFVCKRHWMQLTSKIDLGEMGYFGHLTVSQRQRRHYSMLPLTALIRRNKVLPSAHLMMLL